MQKITPTYRRLSLDELKTLEEQFTKYLAVQGMDASSWIKLLEDDAPAAEQYINDFSNVVFEDLLASISYLISVQKQFIICVHCQPTQNAKVMLTHSDGTIDFREADLENPAFYKTPGLHLAMKEEGFLAADRKRVLFELTERGYAISDGKMYKSLCMLYASSQQS